MLFLSSTGSQIKMSKINNFNYFPHDCNARADEEILKIRAKFGNVAYAWFFMIIECMAEGPKGELSLNGDAIGGLSLALNTPKEELAEFIEYAIDIGLFKSDGEKFWNERMMEHLSYRKKFKEWGKKGAKLRWGDKGKNRGGNSTPNSNKRKENNNKIINNNKKKNIKKKKDKVPLDDFINLFNKLFKRNFRVTTGRRKKLKTRLETFSYEEIKKALYNLSRSEFHQGKNDRGWKADPDFLLRSDEQVDKWLNTGSGRKQQKTLAERLKESDKKKGGE